MRPDPTPLTDAQRDLASAYLPLARKLAWRLRAAYPPGGDEFESAACLALVEAARSYDPARNIRFASFARFRILGAMGDAGKSLERAGVMGDRRLGPRPLASRLPANRGMMINIPAAPPAGAGLDELDSFERRLRGLPARHAEVCRLYYGHGLALGEVAGEIGCSPEEAVRLHRQALQLLAPAYGDDGRPFRPAGLRTRNRPLREAS